MEFQYDINKIAYAAEQTVFDKAVISVAFW